jgi:hypothetical protein
VASKVQVLLLDDVDGGVAEETVAFGLDGSSYEIDLSGTNAQQLRDSLSAWIGHARKVGRSGAARTTPAGRTPRSSERTDLTAVRAWARENGFEISDRGRVSSQVLEAYKGAH